MLAGIKRKRRKKRNSQLHLCNNSIAILDGSIQFEKNVTTFESFQHDPTIPSLVKRKSITSQLKLLSLAIRF